ncbi:hypothetical protein [Lachnoanaerobaculum orale]|uniref:hypothetical protein n=1 Tax=Lachnoanaerobaculum orale TaxID=979627 RepID=UPI0023A8764D|nr:hypothetical protein [Lachnoanaerobaculum orale]
MLNKILILSTMFVLSFPCNIFAHESLSVSSESVFCSSVPAQMKPSSVIKYTDMSHYDVLEGGDLPLSILTKDGLTLSAQRDANLNRAIGKVSGRIIRVPDPAPAPGLVVIYDEEGFIKEFRGATYRYRPLKIGTTSPQGTYQWGSHNNTLTVFQNSVSGTGRLTTFSDRTGENDNRLKKGDVATRGDRDNPAHGTRINVTAPTKNGRYETYSMIKADNGSLPDAILDIWKTGVENWGYTWRSSLSINGGSYTYNY